MSQSAADQNWAEYAPRLGLRIRELRSRRGISQELAYAAGLGRYTLQRYEKGEISPGVPTGPSIRSLMAISQVLDVDLAELLPDSIPDLRSGSPKPGR